ncbi:MAG: tRNA uridine-5-carboxymethylaminomethyl(34) synthesis GTPase MnmE [Synergistaceae bacterium]|nr:tRNA uridine-5-carboxymethylaminomethyl(34) synthesis GTPase MnmE [Synergistaceae bacterium]
MLFSDDVIAAVATAWGEAAIAIVRLSGRGSVGLVDRFFRGAGPIAGEPPRRMALGSMAAQDGARMIDQVLAVRFEEGASYTGEEAAEVHCHGGAAAARACMDVFLESGARAALPGEFTKRAFLNGRIDLAQAEAVLGVIRARTDAELASSARSLQGELSRALRDLSGEMISALAGIEAHIDYPDEVSGDERSEIAFRLSEIGRRTRNLIERCRAGLILKNGVRVAIIGRPNVGKSSLLNSLSGEDRAIVTDIPGTTRDTLDVSIVHRGLFVSLIDTAGMRDDVGFSGGAGVIEGMGIARSRAAISGSDICALVVDASVPLAEADLSAASALRGKSSLLALNKRDLPRALSRGEIERLGHFKRVVEVSALTGDGVGAIKDAIFDMAAGDASLSEGVLAGERIIGALMESESCIREAESALEGACGVDVAGSLLAEASERVMLPLGGDAPEDLMDAIFRNFCVGK